MATGIAFVAPASLWTVAVGLLWLIPGAYRPDRNSTTRIHADIRQGIRFVTSHPVLRSLAAMVGVLNLALSASGSILVLFAVGQASVMQLSVPQYGILLTAPAIGSLLGTLFTRRLQVRFGSARLLLATILGTAIFVGAPFLTTSIWLIAAAFVTGGFTMMIWNIITVSYRQAVSPDNLLGRVNSVYRLLAWGAMPIGAIIGGLLGEFVGVRPTFAAMSLVVLALLVPISRLGDDHLTPVQVETDHDLDA